MVKKTEATLQKEPKDLRYRRQAFPNADKLIFETSRKGFVPVPIILRKLLRHLSAAEIRVLLYLHLRASRHGICYPTLEEIAYDLGLNGRKNLTPHIKSLEGKKLISTATVGGKRFFLVHDPRVSIEHLVVNGKLREEDLNEINDLYEDLNQQTVAMAKKAAAQSAP